MNSLEEDFIPDFSYKTSAGLVSNAKSKMRHYGNMVYVSVNNILSIWTSGTLDPVKYVSHRQSEISCFVPTESIIILGYQDGKVVLCGRSALSAETIQSQDVDVLHIHTRQITDILVHNEGFFSSSDSIVYYDMKTRESMVYLGSPVLVSKIHIVGTKLFGVCVDNVVRLWELEGSSKNVYDMFSFDRPIVDILVHPEEFLVLLKNGDSFLVNLETRERKKYSTHRRPKGIYRAGTDVYIHTEKKLMKYVLGKTSKLGMRLIDQIDLDTKIFRIEPLENGTVMYLMENTLGVLGSSIRTMSHTNSLISIGGNRYGNIVYTFSKEKLIVWERNRENPAGNREIKDKWRFEHEYIVPMKKIEYKKGKCFLVFNEYLLVAHSEGLSIYGMQDHKFICTLDIHNIDSMDGFGNILGIARGTSLEFYMLSLDSIDKRHNSECKEYMKHSELRAAESIQCIKFTPDGNNICIGTFDNKIYIYDYPSLTMRLQLYGHALPVRSFSISSDSNILVSCGADRVIKIWNLTYGDCQKTLLVDSYEAVFLNHELFLCTSRDGVHYYKGFERLKTFKCYNSKFLHVCNEHFVASSENGISSYWMEKYEFVKEDQEETKETPLAKAVDLNNYSLFINSLEDIGRELVEESKLKTNQPQFSISPVTNIKIETSMIMKKIKKFFNFLEKLEFNVLKEFVTVMDTNSLEILIESIYRIYMPEIESPHSEDGYVEPLLCNMIFLEKLFLLVFRSNRDLLVSYGNFKILYRNIFKSLKIFRELVGVDIARLKIKLESKKYDLLDKDPVFRE